jgi:hypothetical protein
MYGTDHILEGTLRMHLAWAVVKKIWRDCMDTGTVPGASIRGDMF